MKTISQIICGATICLFLTGCASQRDVLTLDERWRSLERQNRELQQQQIELQKQFDNELAKLGATRQNVETDLRTQSAGISADLHRIKQELRLLTGRMEVVEHTTQRGPADDSAEDVKRQEQLQAVTRRASQLDQRVAALEQFLDLKRPAATRAPALPAPTPGTQPGPAASVADKDNTKLTDSQIYARAMQALDNGQMDDARKEFQTLLNRYPQSELANNAQFWIGESHYRERWYEKAILEYQTVIEKYPKGTKVPAAMLKQGFAFLQLGDEANARLVLGELQKRYPQSSEAKVAASKLNDL